MLRAAAFLSLLLIAQVPSAAPQHPYVYRGTVQAVQPRGNSLDVVTGVGYALRLVHMRALPATLIRKSGAHAELRQLVPGDVVRAACRATPTGLIADTIETIQP